MLKSLMRVSNVLSLILLGFCAASVPVDYSELRAPLDELKIPREYATRNFLSIGGERTKEVNASSVSDLLGAPNTLVVDVRDASAFEKSRIAGSVNVPAGVVHLRSPVPPKFAGIVLVYCDYKDECEWGHAARGVLSRCRQAAGQLRYRHGLDAMLVVAGERDLKPLDIPFKDFRKRNSGNAHLL